MRTASFSSRLEIAESAISPTGVIKISCGGHYTMAVTILNDIYVWGYNKNGQLGLGDFIDRNIPTLLDVPK